MGAQLFQADRRVVSTQCDAGGGNVSAQAPSYGTIAKNRNTAKMTKCTIP
jgi:hypothetical protein